MMKAATNGAAAFGVPIVDPTKKPGEPTKDTPEGGARGKKGKKGEGLEDEKGEEDEDEDAARRDRLNLMKKGADDDEDGGGKGDLDLDDDDIEKGVSWLCFRFCMCFQTVWSHFGLVVLYGHKGLLLLQCWCYCYSGSSLLELLGYGSSLRIGRHFC